MFPHERKLQQMQQQRQLVEQLRREAAINRINVSQVSISYHELLNSTRDMMILTGHSYKACKDLQKYCSDHQNEDFLVKGFASQKQNPFREKSSCAVL